MSCRSLLTFIVVGCAGGADPKPPDDAAPADGADSDTDSDSDADSDVDTDADSDADSDSDAGEWLTTVADTILLPDGSPFHGRGANIQDTRSCNACTWQPPSPDEVMRRIDELTDVWGGNFLRLTLESYASGAYGQVHWETLLDDPQYLADVTAIVRHAEEKPGVYVLLSLWVDPTFGELGWPTPATEDVWRLLAETFRDDEKVLFGLCNEPQYNFDGALDPDVWDAMNATVAAIRDVEDQGGSPHHVISVQGTGGWSRLVDYYVDHPITAGGGVDIVYEVHVYDPVGNFDGMVVAPGRTIPLLIGEIGPSPYSSYDDVDQELQLAEDNDVPWLAWTFHPRCPPNLLVDNTGGDGCGVGMALEPTGWGRQIQDRLAVPW